jgi:hypothetical protein
MLMNRLWTWIKDRWQRDASHDLYSRLPTPNDASAKAGENYFRLTLSEMFLTDERNWFASWHPAAYIAVRFRFGDKEEILNHVAGPSALKDIDMGSINRGVAVNYSITPLVPYNGGEIEIEAGLVAVKGEDDVKKLLKVLGDFSKTLAVPQISTALNFATPLADGAAELLGASDNRPVLRLHDIFNEPSNILRAMHLIVVADRNKQLDKAKMSIEDGRLRYEGRSLTGYNYMVLRIDTPADRNDWDSLSAIEEPYLAAIEQLQAALLEPDPDKQKTLMTEADRRLGAAKLAAFRAKELTKVVGRNQAIKGLQDGYNRAKEQLGGAGGAPAEFPRNLTGVLAARISVEEARRIGEMREWDLLAN